MPSPFTFDKQGQSGIEVSEIAAEPGKGDRRLLHHPLDAHRRAQSRAGAAADAHGQRAADPPVDGLVAALRPRHAKTRTCPATSSCAPARRSSSAPRSGATAFCPPNTRRPASITADMRVEKLVANIRNPSLDPRPAARAARPARQAQPACTCAQRDGDAELEGQIQRDGDGLPACRSEAMETFDISREPAARPRDVRRTRPSPAPACSPGGWWKTASASSPSTTPATDNQPWDTHTNHNERHPKLCADGDRAAAALIADLKAARHAR